VKMKRLPSFAFLLPAASLVVSLSVLLATTLLGWWNLSHAPRNAGKIVIGNGELHIEMPADRAWQFAFRGAAEQVEGPISAINFPGAIIEAVVLGFRDQGAVWYPEQLGLEAWRAITLPFFALPAWWFVGRGVDGLTGERRTGKTAMVLSILFSALCLLLLTIGIFCTASEDWKDHSDVWLLLGLAEWSFFFAAPAGAWFRQRNKAKRPAVLTAAEDAAAALPEAP